MAVTDHRDLVIADARPLIRLDEFLAQFSALINKGM